MAVTVVDAVCDSETAAYVYRLLRLVVDKTDPSKEVPMRREIYGVWELVAQRVLVGERE